MTNPLMAYKPHEKVFVKLPTEGKFYEEGVLLQDGTEEFGVKPMSAIDEMLFNNPDALMNGRAVSQVIENCVPKIANANELAISDIEALLLGIKLASNEETYDVNTKCPSCDKEGSFERDIDELLMSIDFMQDEYSHKLNDDITIVLRPNSWKSHSKLQQMAFKQQRLVQVAQNPNLSDTEKGSIFNEMFSQMVSLNIDLVSDSVHYVLAPEGKVTHEEYIREFLETLGKDDLEAMSSIIEGINDTGVSHTMPVGCPHCGHEWDLEGLRFDPSYFFE